MPYIILIAVLLVAGALYKSYNIGVTNGQASLKAQLEAADQKLAQAASEARQEAENKIIDMSAAYEVGESRAKVIYLKQNEKGASDVKNFAVFSNPICVLPSDSLRNLNSARASVRTASDSGEAPGAVPGPGTPAVGNDGGAVPANAPRPRPMGKVY